MRHAAQSVNRLCSIGDSGVRCRSRCGLKSKPARLPYCGACPLPHFDMKFRKSVIRLAEAVSFLPIPTMGETKSEPSNLSGVLSDSTRKTQKTPCLGDTTDKTNVNGFGSLPHFVFKQQFSTSKV